MTRPIRAVIADDEPRARSRLRRLLGAHPDVAIVSEAANGDEALQRVLSDRPDVVFLDVRMPGPLGTEVAQRITEYLPASVRPAVVFTTAHAEHAVQAFAVQGTDYLLKPIERDRLAEALRRVRAAVWSAAPDGLPAEPAATVAPALTGHHGTSIFSVPVGTVRALQVEDGSVWATTTDGERTRVGESLAEVEAALPSPPFYRVSRGAVVHLERVLRVRPTASGTFEAELEGGQLVPVSRRRSKRLLELMGLR